MSEDDPTPSRRQFVASAASAAAAFVITACGPKRLFEVPKHRLRRSLRELERQYRESSGKAVTVADTPAIPGVRFAYALDISRCIGCRRCVYACVEENNLSRDPQIHWIRVLAMEKEKGVDFAHADPYYQPEQVPQPGHFYVPVACQQCENPPCVKVCPRRRHLEGAGRHRGDRLRLVHRLPLLHGRLSLRRAPLQLGDAVGARAGAEPEHARARKPPAAARASSRSAPSASSALVRAATPRASRSARSARASSATCSIRRARSATSSKTSASSC